MYEKSIFIHRRDLRIYDNIGFITACKNSKMISSIFIFTPEQITIKNKYKSNNAIQFMGDCLDDLKTEYKKKDINFSLYYGYVEDIISSILNNNKIDAIYVNMDYTPYSIKRDNIISNICSKYDVSFISVEDYLLYPIGYIKNGSGDIYTKFTPYYNKVKKEKEIKMVDKYNFKDIESFNINYKKKTGIRYTNIKDINKYIKKIIGTYNNNIWRQGGRTNAINELNKTEKNLQNYNKTRNCMIQETTNLSAYIKFGCISIREVYWYIKSKIGRFGNDLIKQLFWREFYYNIAFTHKHVIGNAMKPKYDNIKWNNNISLFKKWCDGNTGIPIIDAAMRSMNITGYMHNRGRLIVSNFLVKVLLIDWRWGERYFAKKLYDYDPVVNNGNWQWIAGSGADSQPYFRVFNPYLQSLKTDFNGEYIKKWVPELKEVESKHLHNWAKYRELYIDKIDYPEPMINYDKMKKIAMIAYKKIF